MIDTTPPSDIAESDIAPAPTPDQENPLVAGLLVFPEDGTPTPQSVSVPSHAAPDSPKAANGGGLSPSRTLLGSVYFASNSTTLDPSEQVVLIDLLPQIANKQLLVLGYSDRIGDKQINAHIAYKRARAVKDFYVTTGSEKDSLFAASKGSCCYKTEGKTENERRLNRRVEIYRTTESFNPVPLPSTQE